MKSQSIETEFLPAFSYCGGVMNVSLHVPACPGMFVDPVIASC
jgi:hypothetical protein